MIDRVLKLRIFAGLVELVIVLMCFLLVGAVTEFVLFPNDPFLTTIELSLFAMATGWLVTLLVFDDCQGVYRRLGLRLVKSDGKPVARNQAFIRGLYLVCISSSFAVLSQAITGRWEYLLIVYGMYSLVSNANRGETLLHDRLAGTKVVELVPRKLL